jgi:hypothetical protein
MSPSRPRSRRSDGQVLVIFAGAIIALMAMVAVVIDMSWYWANSLRVQRAADAAALAGVVWLPGQPSTAYSTARAEAVKNGYTDGVNGVTVTPTQDAANNRRLAVTINGTVGTFFMRVVGINTLPISKIAKADFILPVPMGSPQNYYGVGSLDGLQTTTTTNTTYTSTDSGWKLPGTAVAGGAWSGTGNLTTNNNSYATSNTNNQQQQWRDFGLAPTLAANQSMTTPIGIEVRFTKANVSATCANSQIRVDLSWNGGATWSSTQTTANLTTTNLNVTFGSAANTTVWGAHSWTYSDFTDTNFRIRFTALKGCATAGTTLRLDMLEIRVSYRIATTTTTSTTSAITRPVYDPVSGASLASQGFWGAVITRGGDRQNGDRYSPANNSLVGGANPEYDPAGYDYTIEIGATGSVSIFDPTYCAVGANTSGGFYGTGDHWIGTAGTPVTTVFSLYNTHGTLLDLNDDTLVYSSGSLFANQVQADYSGDYGTPPTGYTDCGSSPYHNAWWTPSQFTGLSAGTYRLNVNTSSTNNNGTNAENLWSIEVSGGSAPRVYGGGRMAAYNNLQAGTQLFYLAQIDAVHAGKTMEIELFDPGDVSGNGFLRILSPDGNAYNYTTFSYTADNGRSGNNVTSVQTAASGSSYFNNSVMTIQIVLPTTYGSGGLTPPGETQAGWWKIEYQVGGGNDTTTWQVNIRGNPVHLVVP